MRPLSPMSDRGHRMARPEQRWRMRVLTMLIKLLKVCVCLFTCALMFMMVASTLSPVAEVGCLLLNFATSAHVVLYLLQQV